LILETTTGVEPMPAILIRGTGEATLSPPVIATEIPSVGEAAAGGLVILYLPRSVYETTVSKPAGIVEQTPVAMLGDYSTSEHPCRFHSVEWRGRRLVLRRSIDCTLSREGSLYVIEYPPLGVHSYAETLQDAKRDFAEELFVIWEDYGLAPDEDLAPSGLRLKTLLKEVVLRETRVDAA
jgi:hypothetical protein